ncbi:hypothetical protein [Elizabethkingia meningoseptica]|uniref:hypothetical protein n=1 Tax=Elizabethkingia meningoseptica TaxID=238 RepID=UPI0009991A79|nr:hypothetical protein [Elizabethkingia meningoseptica]
MRFISKEMINFNTKSYTMENNDMTTLVQVMNTLKRRGVDKEIQMTDDKKFILQNSNKEYKPEDLTIIKVYRFEGDSNPSDNAALYLVEDTTGQKAYIIDSYGAESNYAGSDFNDFLSAIVVDEREGRNLRI